MSEDKENLVAVIDRTQERFVKLAPQHIKYDAEKGFAIQLLSNNEYLGNAARAYPAALAQAITNVAAIGLSLNPAEKLAYLIPRNVKVGQNQYQTRVFLEPSYMGLCKLATDTGSIEWVQADCVYANDTFKDNGFGNRPEHSYLPFAKAEQRGEFVGVYCVAKTKSGDYLTTIMTAEEVHSIRDRSESYKKSKSGPWVTDFKEQAKKTVVRRAFKMWPRSDLNRLAEAVEISNENEGFDALVTSPEIRQYNGEQKSYFDQLITNNDCLGMYVFRYTLFGYDATSNGASVWTSLQHSFPKGKKGSYRKLVDDLLEAGKSRFQECLDTIISASKEDDKFAAIEILEQLSTDAINLIKERGGQDVAEFIDEAINQQKAA